MRTRNLLIFIIFLLGACGPGQDVVHSDFERLVKERVSEHVTVNIQQIRSGNGNSKGRFEYVQFSLYVTKNTKLRSGLKLEQGKTISDCTAALIYQKKEAWKMQQFEISCKSMPNFRLAAQV